MPTTLTGLLLFVALLLPGLLYVAIRERKLPSQMRSPFRETAIVVAASTMAWLAALVLVGLSPAPSPDVEALLRDPSGYVEAEYRFLGESLLVLLGVAVLAALIAAIIAGFRSAGPTRAVVLVDPV